MDVELLTHLGIYGLIGYMLFVIAMVAKEANVPSVGKLWMFIVLGTGFSGWIVKDIITFAIS
ncbi:MAG: DUF2788 domain-containing protein [Betaproteobacteria bacterium]|nr:DUF2788 domain-containing protein [Betaproteobacteria bacterium]NBO96691.1 DUF2788 domain-containing protein [Betaproteobacteria bacterium]NBP35873.1 DUF2788 domain-containing protein [Betaproteobacteria bacterium]NBP39113.1 DUF2788 domain-containing protein [Betaproteobacteria bacterium]NBQ78461.1 DUF2788 domain-containing protein [Betaproteobacteria bacterium]